LEEVEDKHYEQGKCRRDGGVGRGGGAFQRSGCDVDKGCPAVYGRLLRGAGIGLADGLRGVAGEGGEDGHGVLQTRVASWACAAGKSDTEGQRVHIGVFAAIRPVGDSIGVT